MRKYVVETFGVPALSANPEKGVNAVYKMCEAIQAIREIEPPVQDKLGKGILELTDVKYLPHIQEPPLFRNTAVQPMTADFW